MYKIKDAAHRLAAFVAAFALLLSAGSLMLPELVSADALNPLTQRSLTLSSSSPGWSYTDGSGNPWDISCYPYTPPGANTCAPGFSPYAYPNSGANGQKTGETFSFRVSTDTHTGTPEAKALTFQFCTKSAGECLAPGDDAYTGSPGSLSRAGDTSSTSDLNVVTSSPSEILTGDVGSYFDLSTGDATNLPPPDNSKGNFVVLTKDVSAGSWSYSGGWSMSTKNLEDPTFSVAAGTATGKNNFITLTNSGGGLDLHSTGQVKVVFLGTNTNYITNPGSGAFFVKLNDFNDAGLQNWEDNVPNNHDCTAGVPDPVTPGTGDCPSTVIDGGVTVANVMNQSIQIETKVLETMDFSVGTVDPDTLTHAAMHTAGYPASPTHGTCDPILTSLTPSSGSQNFLLLGDQTSESSLSTTHTYGTYSYFRLSSNSTGGATVYYSGATLSDTEGDQLTAAGTTAKAPTLGSAMFGLALDNAQISGSTNYPVNYTYNDKAPTGADDIGDFENANDGYPAGVDASFTTDLTGNASAHNPQLYPLAPATAYGGGSGVFDAYTSNPVTTSFAFDSNANSVPAVLASENTHVVDCVTGKVRYVADIAATTPAGIYTTKINYIASPQY